MLYFCSKCENFKVIGSVPHQSTSRFESHGEFCVGNMFPTIANFTTLNARKISIVASFFMCHTVPPLSYMAGRKKKIILFFFLWSNRSSVLRKMDPGLGSEVENKECDHSFSVIIFKAKTVSGQARACVFFSC